MPRRYYNKRYPRKRYNKNSYSLARRAYAMAKKNQTSKELKYVTTVFDNLVGTAGSLTNVSVIGLGNTNNDREGNVINPTSIKLRIDMTLNPASSDVLIRVIIFQWITENPLNISDYLQTVSIESFKSDVKRFESRTLYDNVFRLSNSGTKTFFTTIKRKMNGYITYPDANTNANRGQTFVALLSDDNENKPTVIFNSRLYFRDP